MIIVQATVRTRTLQNKAVNLAENLSLQDTPMGLLLGWLGTKATEEQSPSKRQ